MNYSLLIGCIAFVMAVVTSILTIYSRELDMVMAMFYAIAVFGIFSGMLNSQNKTDNDG